MQFQVGDIVGRKSYDCDVHFRIIRLNHQKKEAILKGIDMRLLADAPIDDLVLISSSMRSSVLEREEQHTSSSVKEIKLKREQEEESFFRLPGRVLHMDGDPNYLKKCLALYKELDIPTYGIHVPEKDMPKRVIPLLERVKPDILVITGHDAYSKSKGARNDLAAYRHSAYFKEAVLKARQYEKNRDNLIIFAGACQSYFEILIQAGANFASSPGRVNIHALDPVYIVEKACYTPINRIINLQEVVEHSVTGSSGLGGVDTRGTHRLGKPYLKE